MNEKKAKTNGCINFSCVAIQNKEGQFLLVYNKKWNSWSFPGGKLEKGETSLAAAKREVYEETGLAVENLEKIAEGIFWNKWKGYFYWARKHSGEQLIKEEEKEKIQEVKFFSAEEIAKINANESTNYFLKELIKWQAAVQRMSELIVLLEKWDYEYHFLNQPTVDDKVYDQTLKELRELENGYNFILPSSPSQKVGVCLLKKFRPVKHQIPMLSLDSVDNEEDLNNFDKRVKKKTELNELEYLCELKIDGLSASLIYRQGKLIRIATRGDGWTGEDVTLNKNLIQDVPFTLPNTADYEIRGEIYMKKAEFLQLNEELKKQNLGLLANPRNAAAGTLRTLVPIQKRNLHFFAYQLFGDEKIKNQGSCLQKLTQLGFQVTPVYQLCKTLKEAHYFFQQAKEIRENLDFEIDGIVIKINDYSYYNLLGQTSKFPRWALAYKFPSSLVISKIKNILTEMTRSGRVSYVAQIEPVVLQGSRINKVTLHNYRFIKELKVNLGDKVVIKKAGNVIPQVVQLIRSNDQCSSYWIPPAHCPSCLSELVWNKEEIYQLCLNETCAEKNVKILVFFSSKPGMDIKGISESIIRKFYYAKFLTNPADFYYLKEKKKELLKLEGLQKKSVDNLLNNIEASKNRTFPRLLTALAIPLLGPVKCKKLASIYRNLATFFESVEKNELDLISKKLGSETEKAMRDFFNNSKNVQMLREMTKINFSFQ